MDTMTHSLTGWAISRVFPQARWGTWTTWVGIIGANLPDSEFLVISQTDKPTYLMHHREWSHCLLGIGLEILAFSAIVMSIAWLLRHRRGNAPAPTWKRVLILTTVAALSHLMLDWWNTFGVKPFFPFDITRYYADVTFLVDPWIWTMLLSGMLLGSPLREHCPSLPLSPRARIATGVSLVLLTIVQVTLLSLAGGAGIIPIVVPMLCAGALVSAWGIRLLWLCNIRPRAFALTALVLIGLYVSVLGTISTTCHDRGLVAHRLQTSDPVISSSANPIPGIPWKYAVVVQTKERMYQYDVNVLQDTVQQTRSFEHHLLDPVPKEVKELRAYRAWKKFARHPVIQKDERGYILGDARYQTTPGRADWTEQRALMP